MSLNLAPANRPRTGPAPVTSSWSACSSSSRRLAWISACVLVDGFGRKVVHLRVAVIVVERGDRAFGR